MNRVTQLELGGEESDNKDLTFEHAIASTCRIIGTGRRGFTKDWFTLNTGFFIGPNEILLYDYKYSLAFILEDLEFYVVPHGDPVRKDYLVERFQCWFVRHFKSSATVNDIVILRTNYANDKWLEISFEERLPRFHHLVVVHYKQDVTRRVMGSIEELAELGKCKARVTLLSSDFRIPFDRFPIKIFGGPLIENGKAIGE